MLRELSSVVLTMLPLCGCKYIVNISPCESEVVVHTAIPAVG